MDSPILRLETVAPQKHKSCVRRSGVAPFEDALRRILEVLFNFVTLQHRAHKLVVDGYACSRRVGTWTISHDVKSRSNIRYDALRSYAYHEPRLRLIERLLANLLARGTFLADGKPVAVDGFCLRQLERWRTKPLPRLSVMGNLGALSPVCNMRCEFCYELGNVLAFDKRMISLQEALTRVKYFDIENRRGLMRALRAGYEDLCNPHALQILESIRAKSTELMRLTTNGSKLRPDVIDTLSTLKPIHLCLSINSVDPDVRRSLMGDRHPEVAISAIPRLREAGIPFTGSIVPWRPFDLGDLERTIRYLDEHEALSIRVCLPGYSRFFCDQDLFDLDDVWGKIVEFVHQVRRQVHCPVVPTPALYGNEAIEAEVDGVYYRSPAWQAGIRAGDVLLQVNEVQVYTRCDARRELEQAWERGRLDLLLRRGKEQMRAVLEAAGDGSGGVAAAYPFWPSHFPSPIVNYTGMLFVGDFDKNDLVQISVLARRYDAKRVLVMTTPLMRRNFLRILELLRTVGNTILDNLELRVAITRQCFWGGNILVGDLNVVSDFITTIRTICGPTKYRPDLVLVPSSFANEWGFDLQGRSFREIEAAIGIPVERMATRRIYE